MLQIANSKTLLSMIVSHRSDLLIREIDQFDTASAYLRSAYARRFGRLMRTTIGFVSIAAEEVKRSMAIILLTNDDSDSAPIVSRLKSAGPRVVVTAPGNKHVMERFFHAYVAELVDDLIANSLGSSELARIHDALVATVTAHLTAIASQRTLSQREAQRLQHSHPANCLSRDLVLHTLRAHLQRISQFETQSQERIHTFLRIPTSQLWADFEAVVLMRIPA